MKHWNTTHGMTGAPEYESWSSMRTRCLNKKSKDYPRYGARGIGICAAWESFEVFYKDMGARPEGTTLERIRNHEGYSKSNCRWATAQEQAVNRRVANTNKTGLAGVAWNKRDSKYEAYLMRQGKRIPIGRHTDFFEICCMRKSAEVRFT